ncbi:MAG TPA: PAS domain S-box protein [Herpetosiphonaceae bacterium]
MSESTASTPPLHDEAVHQLQQRVAELERALEQHKESEQRLSQHLATLHEHVELLNVIHDALLIRDLEGKILYWNRTAEQMYGWTREEAIGSAACELLQTQYPVAPSVMAESLSETGEWRGELSQTSRDGTELIVSSRWKVQRNVWNKPAVVIEINHDITESKRTEHELRASEDELRALFAAINDIIIVADREGRYLKIAPTNPNRLYRPPQYLVGKRMHEVLPAVQADFFLTIVRRALETGEVIHAEHPMVIRDQEIWFSTAFSPLTDDSVLIISRDITLRKRTDQEQVRLREQIIRTQAAMLAELSTPLIPLNDQVLVMPIIGMIDQQRSQALLTALLEGVRSQRVAVVIVDITGVPQIDNQVALALTQAAQSLKLLDTHLILTGLKAEIAQSLVLLGIDLNELIIRSTLQSGISYALDHYVDRNRW